MFGFEITAGNGYDIVSEKEVTDRKEYSGIHPQKLMLYILMGAMTMFFAALTSALIVKKGDYRSWENFKLPNIFLYSTVVILAVSVSIHASLLSFRRARFALFRGLLFLSFVLGVIFLLMQMKGWRILTEIGMPLTGNLSGSFIYLITSLHGLHIAVGLLVTMVMLVYVWRKRKDPLFELRGTVNINRLHHLEMLVQYWHYVDFVWVYLYVFFYMNYT